MTDLTQTDFFKDCVRRRAELLERVEGTKNTEPKWHKHWQSELAAVSRAIWSIAGDYPTDATVAIINRENSDQWRPM